VPFRTITSPMFTREPMQVEPMKMPDCKIFYTSTLKEIITEIEPLTRSDEKSDKNKDKNNG
jgi:hypothetical protein